MYPRLDRRDQLRRRNEVVNWERFRPRLEQLWRPEHQKSSAGRKPWDAVLICKMLILAVLYEMSDAETEFQADDRYTCRRFLGWDETAPVPDEKTLWRYRNRWLAAGAMRAWFDDFNADLGTLGCTPQGGQMIDSSFVLAPKQRRTWAERRALRRGRIPRAWRNQPYKLRRKDLDATWSRKHGGWYFGYQNHIRIDRRYPLIRQSEVGTASPHDVKMFPALVSDENSARDVWADRAYHAAWTAAWLRVRGFRNRIQRRGTRARGLGERGRRAHWGRARVRARVEHGLGAFGNEMGGLRVRCTRLRRARVHVGLQNLADNMRRLVQVKRLAGKLAAASRDWAPRSRGQAQSPHLGCSHSSIADEFRITSGRNHQQNGCRCYCIIWYGISSMDCLPRWGWGAHAHPTLLTDNGDVAAGRAMHTRLRNEAMKQ